MNILKKIKNRIKKERKKITDRVTTASVSQHNDFYIVEFPKSGVTWLSSIIANMSILASGRKEIASFTAAQLYIPDIHVTRDIAEMAYDVPPVRFIKSHAEFNGNYLFVIYLARNPLDVMKSYYRFNHEVVNYFHDFDSFCRSDLYGIPAWKRHVGSWLTGGVIAQRLHLLRYEDLVKDPAVEIELINENFGWKIDRKIIQKAVSLSSLENMMEDEALYKKRNPRYDMTFVKGENKFEIHEKTKRYIAMECESELEILGYRS